MSEEKYQYLLEEALKRIRASARDRAQKKEKERVKKYEYPPVSALDRLPRFYPPRRAQRIRRALSDARRVFNEAIEVYREQRKRLWRKEQFEVLREMVEGEWDPVRAREVFPACFCCAREMAVLAKRGYLIALEEHFIAHCTPPYPAWLQERINRWVSERGRKK